MGNKYIKMENLKERKKEHKKNAKILFDKFHDNFDHFLNMNKKNIDIKKDIRNLEDKEYIKKIDHDLEKQQLYTIDHYWKLQDYLDRCFFQRATIKSWLKKWMEKYIKDNIYIKNMDRFINNYCRDFNYFHVV